MMSGPQILLEHPAIGGWHIAPYDITAGPHAEQLKQRFPDEDELGFVLNALRTATDREDAYRQQHELANRALLISAHGADPLIADEYDRLVGSLAKIGKFIQWFGYIAHQAFDNDRNFDKDLSSKKVTLELGGKRQLGDWECTGILDAMTRGIPAQLQDVEPNAAIEKLSDTDDRLAMRHRTILGEDWRELLNYKIIPLNRKVLDDGGSSFDAAIMRRRRSQYNIDIPHPHPAYSHEPWLRRIEVFSESNYLLLTAYMAEEDRNALMKLYSEYPEAVLSQNNSPAALIGADSVERAIVAEYGTSIDVIPTGKAVMMSMRRHMRKRS